MKPQAIERILCSFGLFLVLIGGMSVTDASGSSLRITMTDGTSVEVPYYWEENGEIKFQIPGGVAGVPKMQVASVQEVITTREFDPQVLLESSESSATVDDQQKALRDLVAGSVPLGSNFEKLNAEEGERLLKQDRASKEDSRDSGERVFGPLFKTEGDFTEMVRIQGNGAMLVLQNVVSSRKDLKNHPFTLILYDSEGNVLQKKPCDLYEIKVDQRKLRELNIRGHLYSVMATVNPDPKIKRFEITAARH